MHKILHGVMVALFWETGPLWRLQFIPSKMPGPSLMWEAQDRAICLHVHFSAVAHPQWRTVPSSSWHCGSRLQLPTSSLKSGSTGVSSVTAHPKDEVRVPLPTNQRCRGAGQTSDAYGFSATHFGTSRVGSCRSSRSGETHDVGSTHPKKPPDHATSIA